MGLVKYKKTGDGIAQKWNHVRVKGERGNHQNNMGVTISVEKGAKKPGGPVKGGRKRKGGKVNTMKKFGPGGGMRRMKTVKRGV